MTAPNRVLGAHGIEALNRLQRAAVECDRPTLVIAGPGAGKTTVLAHRIHSVLKSSPNDNFRILGLSFTTRAAASLKARVRELSEEAHYRARITTFHAFCTGVLRQHGSHLNLKPDFEILARKEDRLDVLGDILEGSIDEVRADAILHSIDRLLTRGYMPGKSEFPLKGSAWMEPYFCAYIEAMLARGCIDFSLSLHLCLRLFTSAPFISEHYRTVYKHICVDEYQDTNEIQDLLLREIVSPRSPGLFVVADPNQSIYSFRGADARRIEAIRSEFQMTVVELPGSFRCPPEIVDVAARLIKHNSSSEAYLSVSNPDPAVDLADRLRVLSFKDGLAEGRWVAEDIKERGLHGADCLILARKHGALDAVCESLSALGLKPYRSEAKTRDFNAPPVRFAWGAIRLIVRPNDGGALNDLLEAHAALTEDLPYSTEEVQTACQLSGEGYLDGFLSTVEERDAWVRLLEQFRNDPSSYVAFWRNVFEETTEDEDVASEIQRWEALAARIRAGADMRINDFVRQMRSRDKQPPPDDDAFQCLTVHLAKGLQAAHVYVLGLAEGIFPSYHALRPDAAPSALQEERRSCYVALTRAESSLTLTYPELEGRYPREPSRFFKEMGLGVTRSPNRKRALRVVRKGP